MRPRGPYVDTFEKPPELFETNLARETSSPLHPGESLPLKALVPETKAIPRPIQDLHLVSASIDEKK